GYVEIQNTKQAGGIAVGVATAEPECRVVDEWKRHRLLGVGPTTSSPTSSAARSSRGRSSRREIEVRGVRPVAPARAAPRGSRARPAARALAPPRRGGAALLPSRPRGGGEAPPGGPPPRVGPDP